MSSPKAAHLIIGWPQLIIAMSPRPVSMKRQRGGKKEVGSDWKAEMLDFRAEMKKKCDCGFRIEVGMREVRWDERRGSWRKSDVKGRRNNSERGAERLVIYLSVQANS